MKNYEAAEMLRNLKNVLHYDPRWIRESESENYSYMHEWMEDLYKDLNSAMKEKGIDVSNLEAAYERFSDESAKKSESLNEINERFGKELAKAGQGLAEKLNIKKVDMSSCYKPLTNDQIKETIDRINYELDAWDAWSGHEYGPIYLKEQYDNVLNAMKNKNMDTSNLENAYENFISEIQDKDLVKDIVAAKRAEAANDNFVNTLSKTVTELANSMGIKETNLYESQDKAIEPKSCEKEIEDDEIDF